MISCFLSAANQDTTFLARQRWDLLFFLQPFLPPTTDKMLIVMSPLFNKSSSCSFAMCVGPPFFPSFHPFRLHLLPIFFSGVAIWNTPCCPVYLLWFSDGGWAMSVWTPLLSIPRFWHRIEFVNFLVEFFKMTLTKHFSRIF